MKKKTKSKKKRDSFSDIFKISNKKNKPKRIFLKSIRLSNFKAFNGENKIELAPMINLIFGKNSTGKSTLLQALRLFRQSYGTGRLTPFNYEPPQQYVGNGGLNIDVGYKGIVNDGLLSKNISLGVETGLYDKQKKEVLKNTNLLQYYYEYKSKFYIGKNLVKDKTILKKIKFSNFLGENTIEFPNTKFFKENTEFAEKLEFRHNIASGAFFLSRPEKKNLDNIFPSYYLPYYYKTSFKPKNFLIKTISDTYDKLQPANIKNLTKYYENFNKYLNKKQKELKIQLKEKKDNKDKSDIVPGRFSQHKNKIKLLQKKITEIRNKKISLDDQLNEFDKIKEQVFAVNEDDMLDFIDSQKELYENREELINDLKKIIIFLKNTKNISKNIFNKFFINDMCKKHKDTIFYNGQFIKNPDVKEKRRYLFRNEIYSFLSINIFLWPLINNFTLNKLNNVNILQSYSSGRFGGMQSGNSILDNVSKAMNKCQIVPSYRLLPKRYFVKGLQTNYVGPGAENLGELLSNVKIKNATNKWFKKLEIPYEVSVQKSGNYYVILFKPKNSNIKISSMHIGLGYSVVLPFIVQCIISKNKIITIEEPEVHLHPKLEADFAELIIESAKLRDNQFILETHSEEFLLRILKSVRQKILKVEDVSINYISQNKKHKNHITKIKVNKYGQYETPWKDDLFADRISELQ